MPAGGDTEVCCLQQQIDICLQACAVIQIMPLKFCTSAPQILQGGALQNLPLHQNCPDQYHLHAAKMHQIGCKSQRATIALRAAEPAKALNCLARRFRRRPTETPFTVAGANIRPAQPAQQIQISSQVRILSKLRVSSIAKLVFV